MPHIICLKPLIPIRKEANHRSEQVSQLLFGECATIPETKSDWLYIQTTFDNYSGWIEAEATTIIHDDELNLHRSVISKPLQKISFKGRKFYVPCGSEITELTKNKSFTMAEHEYRLSDAFESGATNIVDTALKFLHAPYLWGGRTVMGIDCSGLVQIVFKARGIALPRDASKQILEGTAIPEIKKALPGDLCFFNNEQEAITHVGIYLGNDQVIHASKSVRIDCIDPKGIFNKDLGRYTHTFHSIRRVK